MKKKKLGCSCCSVLFWQRIIGCPLKCRIQQVRIKWQWHYMIIFEESGQNVSLWARNGQVCTADQ